MNLFRSLIEQPKKPSTASKFTVLNGLLYMSAGMILLIWPAGVQTLFFDEAFVGREAELMRVVGMTVAIIGWFYIFGGRSRSRQFIAASVVDRIVLVPIVLIPLACQGIFPHLLLTFAILDPVLGLAAWYLLEQECTAEQQVNATQSIE